MICFTKEALELATPEQIDCLLRQMGMGRTRIDVSVDFSLPDGYVYVVMYGEQMIHGGIDPEGVLST